VKGKLDGPVVSYYENGRLKERGTLKDGEQDGPWVYYHDNGTVNSKRTGTYKDDEKVSDTVPPSFLKQ
tara:strand:- start:44 stop:247 length:204 start_codon:yes stop_codon:yes gene_type:complete